MEKSHVGFYVKSVLFLFRNSEEQNQNSSIIMEITEKSRKVIEYEKTSD